MARLAIKVDVDTEGGTRRGVLPLARICQQFQVPALFLFSLGPDKMGRSIRRIFQPGFFRKVMRTRVAQHYDLRSLLNGTLLPAPYLGRRYANIMRQVQDMGFEAGIHAYDHYRWQNYAHHFSLEETRAEFSKAAKEFERIFGAKPKVAGTPGWQTTAYSLAVYDEHGLDYASDTRGTSPFVPVVNGTVFRTPQFPTTLPTLDELLGRPEFPASHLESHYLELLQNSADHVLTIHAELEGQDYSEFFASLLSRLSKAGIQFYGLGKTARQAKQDGLHKLPQCLVKQQAMEGRSGLVAVQG